MLHRFSWFLHFTLKVKGCIYIVGKKLKRQKCLPFRIMEVALVLGEGKCVPIIPEGIWETMHEVDLRQFIKLVCFA